MRAANLDRNLSLFSHTKFMYTHDPVIPFTGTYICQGNLLTGPYREMYEEIYHSVTVPGREAPEYPFLGSE